MKLTDLYIKDYQGLGQTFSLFEGIDRITMASITNPKDKFYRVKDVEEVEIKIEVNVKNKS